MTTIVIADDHPLVRQGLRAVIDATDDLVVVGEADSGVEAVRLCVESRPDVVVMDLQMPGLHGIDATAEVVRAAPGTAVLVLTMFEDDDTVFAAVEAGAVGYLLKGADGADIVAAVRAAAAGQAVFGAAFTKRLHTWFGRAVSRSEAAFPGLTNQTIGAQLFLSPKTVANNVSAILDKLHLASRAEAIARARDAGMGQPPREQ